MPYIENLEKILEKLKTLHSEQFDFRRYITKWDEKGCGSVCCIIGWMPQWFPNCGIYYKKKFFAAKKAQLIATYVE